jgi:hypothetical protein
MSGLALLLTILLILKDCGSGLFLDNSSGLESHVGEHRFNMGQVGVGHCVWLQ